MSQELHPSRFGTTERFGWRSSPTEALGAGRVRYRLGPAAAYSTVPVASRAHAVAADAVVAG